METSIKAYAKINLALNVYDKRDDGYHNIDMVAIPLALHDIIELETLPRGYETFITSDDASLPTDESNLTFIALNRLREHYQINQNFMMHIYKRIPMNAGLGGGSANAAAVMNVLLKLIKEKPSYEKLIQIARSTGGDVAFCLFNKPARCKGIGEDLEFIKVKKKYHILLIKPMEGVSTARAFNDYDNLDPKPEKSNIARLVEALEKGDDEVIAQEMKNGLQESAAKLVPEIVTLVNKLKEDGFPLSMMSGSGSTVFAMSTDKKKILEESKKFDKEKYQIIITSTL